MNTKDMLLKLKIVLLCLMLALLTSCHSTIGYGMSGSRRPFLGTQAVFTMPVPDSPEDPATVCDYATWYTIKAVDLPFTLVADCFWWPMSLYYNAKNEKGKKKEKASHQDEDSETSPENNTELKKSPQKED